MEVILNMFQYNIVIILFHTMLCIDMRVTSTTANSPFISDECAVNNSVIVMSCGDGLSCIHNVDARQVVDMQANNRMLTLFQLSRHGLKLPLYTTTVCEKLVDSTTGLSTWLPPSSRLYFISSLAHPCHYSMDITYLAQALMDIFTLRNKCDILLIYSGAYSKLPFYIRNIRRNYCKIVDYLASNDTVVNDVMNLVFTYNLKGIILAAGSHNPQLMNDIQTSGKYHTDTVVIVISDGMMMSIKPKIKLGEKILIVERSHILKHCIEVKDNVVSNYSYSLWYLDVNTETLTQAGMWSNKHGLQLPTLDLWTFYKFKNKVFKVASLEWPVFHFREEVKGKYKWRGIAIELLESLAEKLNFTFNISQPEDRKWGGINPDGTWNGMVDMVMRGEADFAVAKFTITNIRDSVIDFTVPFWYEPVVLAMRRPQENKMFVYLGPLQRKVWIYVCLLLPVFGVTLGCMRYMYINLREDLLQHKLLKLLNSIGIASWFGMGAMLQQGAVWLPFNSPLRLLVALWWCYALVIASTFTGNLIAVLTVPKEPPPIQSLEELSLHPDYTAGVVDGAALHTLFQKSTEGVYQVLWEKHISVPANRVRNHGEGLSKAKSEQYVYMGEIGGVAPIVYKDCNYVMGKERFFPSSFAFVFPENSSYLPLFNERLMQLYDTGLMEYWKGLYYPEDGCSQTSTATSSERASLREVQGIFILLSLGVTAAFMVFVIEVILSYLVSKKDGVSNFTD